MSETPERPGYRGVTADASHPEETFRAGGTGLHTIYPQMNLSGQSDFIDCWADEEEHY